MAAGVEYRFPFAVEDVLRRYAESGFPETPSDITEAIRGPDDLRLVLDLGASFRMKRLDGFDRDTVVSFLEGRGISDSFPCLVAISFNGITLDAVTYCGNTEDAAWAHGMRCRALPDEPLMCEFYRLVTEVLLYMCQRELAIGMEFGGGRMMLEANGFYGRFSGTSPHSIRESDIVRDFGLRKGRLDAVRDMMKAVLASRGVYRKVTGVTRLDQDLVRKTRRVRAMEANNPFRRCFSKTDFGGDMEEVMFMDMCDCFHMLEDAGIMLLEPSKEVALRVRRFSYRSFVAMYRDSFRDVLIPVSQPGHFVHEYAHALDFCYGRPSGCVGFRRVLVRYREEVIASAPEGFDRNYYLSATEAFARCMETYVLRRVGPCTLQVDHAESPYYTMSEELAMMVDGYFDSFFEELRTRKVLSVLGIRGGSCRVSRERS